MDQIVEMGVPKKVIIPMEQYLGLMCEPLVGIGDKVKVGQKIGESKQVVAQAFKRDISKMSCCVE
ncbi:MAG: hypothetical protein ACE5J5_04775 [Candidatus Hydrothermarchaeales archaeon]